SGATLGAGALLGVLSLAPSGGAEAAGAGTAWLGSPPRLLPRRQESAGFVEARTYTPSPRLRASRAAFQPLRVTLPPARFILVTAAVLRVTLHVHETAGLAPALALLPIAYAACCAAVLAAVAIVKWLVVGRYRSFTWPLWSAFTWRLELVNALYEFLLTPLALEPLQGTPFLPWCFRLLGARVGRRVYAHTTGLLEWDLVEIGDGAALNEDCVLQTHLFEDRILKASPLRVGERCSIGAFAVVLYGSEMERGARL